MRIKMAAPPHRGAVTHHHDHVMTLHSFSTRNTKKRTVKNGNDTLTDVLLSILLNFKKLYNTKEMQ